MQTAIQSSTPSLNWMNINVQTKTAAQKLRAFNHPLRQQILTRLEDQGEQTVTQLFTHFNLEQSVASQQLGILRRAGLVSIRRCGKNIYYSVDRDALWSLYNNAMALNNN